MKRYAAPTAILFTLAVALSGCLEIETTTRVHGDGHLTRTVVISGDSSDFTKLNKDAFGLDSGWTVISDSLSHGTNRELTLQREFADAESASQALTGIPMKRQGISFRVERSFRWFTTHYRFEEIWQREYLFHKVPISAYLSPEEIQMFRAGELKGPDSLLTEGQKRHRADLEKRSEEWVNRNSFEEVFEAFLDGVRRVNDTRLSVDSAQAGKERCYAALQGQFTPPLTRSAPITAVLQKVLENPVVPRALEAARPELEKHDRAVEFMEHLQTPGQTVSVVMPGIITNTNGSSVEGNTVRWKDFKDNAFYEGYTMWAESSAVNWWAVVVTAIALLAIGASLVIGLLRRPARSASGEN